MKRPREGEPYEAMATGCSPHRWQLESPASKRVRAHAEAVVAATSSSAFMGPAEAGPSSAPTDLSAALRQQQRVDPATGELLFTMEQVKDIVRLAVDEKERGLREQYDRVLATKLQEQYMAFAKFNEDYISRSLKSNDLQYVS